MTSREELIEEADGLYDKIGTSIYREQFREWYLSKFGKAQAPCEAVSDEEREAITKRLDHAASSPYMLPEHSDLVMSAVSMLRRPAQAEPTDAQVLAALNGYKEADWRLAGYMGDPSTSHSLTDWDPGNVSIMRAALKAASAAGQRYCEGRPAQVVPTGCPHEAYEADREGSPARCADCGENMSPSALKTVLTTTPKQSALPEYFAPKPPMTTNRFTAGQEEQS